MPISINCPSCKMRLLVADTVIGTLVRCPSCNGVFTAPGNTPPVQPPPPANLQFQPAGSQRTPYGGPPGHFGGGPAAPGTFPGELPGRNLSIAVMSMLGVIVVAELFNILTAFVVFGYYFSKTATQVAADALAEDVSVPDVMNCCSFLFYLSVLIGTIVTFCLWIHQAHANLPLLSAIHLHYTPAWAVGWFFIPGANLVLPVMVMLEILNASNSSVPEDKSQGLTGSFPAVLVFVWWACLLIGQMTGVISFIVTIPGGQTSRGQHLASAVLSIFASLFSIVAAGLAILLIRQIQLRQTERFQAVAGS
jgi:predicted Zn finger-like uncharacterized protein